MLRKSSQQANREIDEDFVKDIKSKRLAPAKTVVDALGPQTIEEVDSETDESVRMQLRRHGSHGKALMAANVAPLFAEGTSLTQQKDDCVLETERVEQSIGTMNPKRDWGRWSPQAAVAGSITGVNMFIDCLAIGSILFSGPASSLQVDLAIKHALIGVVVAQLVNGAFSGYTKLVTPTGFEVLPFISPVFTAIEAVMIEDGLSTDDVATTLLWVSAMIPCFSSLILTILGYFEMGRLVNFVPQTVLIGLFGCVGYSLWAVSFDFACGKTFDITQPEELEWIWEPTMVLKWALAQVLGVLLFVVGRKAPKGFSPKVFPAYLLLGIIVFNVTLFFVGNSLDESADQGWLMAQVNASFPTALYTQLWSLEHLHFSYLTQNLVDLILAACLGPVLNLVINTTMLQPLLKEKSNLDSELMLNGRAMLCTCLAGGFPAYVAIVNTNLHIKSGGNARWSTVLAGSVVGMFFAVPHLFEVVRIIPNCVIGGMFVNFGVDFLSATIAEVKRIKMVEYVLVWLMVGASIVYGFTMAVTLGLVWEFITFINEYSKVKHVMVESYLNVLKSHSSRTIQQRQALDILASSVYITRFVGYMYFATVVDIVESIEKRIKLRAERVGDGEGLVHIRQVVLDFTTVPSMDTSALMAFCTMCRSLQPMGIQHVHFTGLGDRNVGLQKQIRGIVSDLAESGFIVFHNDFDECLPVLELNLLKSVHSLHERWTVAHAQGDKSQISTLERCRAPFQLFAAWLDSNRPCCEDVGSLWLFIFFGCCERQFITRGTTIAKAGDCSRGIWLLLAGSVNGYLSVDFKNDGLEHFTEEQVENSTGNGLIIGVAGLQKSARYVLTHVAGDDCDTFFISSDHIARMQERGAHRAVAALQSVAVKYTLDQVRVLQRHLVAMEQHD